MRAFGEEVMAGGQIVLKFVRLEVIILRSGCTKDEGQGGESKA